MLIWYDLMYAGNLDNFDMIPVGEGDPNPGEASATFLNKDFSLNIVLKDLRILTQLLQTHTEGGMSHFLYLGLSCANLFVYFSNYYYSYDLNDFIPHVLMHLCTRALVYLYIHILGQSGYSCTCVLGYSYLYYVFTFF